MSTIKLKRASVTDMDTLVAIEKSIGETKIYSPSFTDDEWEEEFTKNEVYLIEKDGQTVGSVSYRDEGHGSIYFSGIVVSPPFQNQGIGTWVIKQLLEKFKDATRIWFVTHPDNPALRLYQHLGFVIESRSENHYGDGEPRLILARTL